jgi:hypothetical protein
MSSLSGNLTRFSVWCRGLATDRVGISARFDDLRDTPHALHFAKVMLRGRPDEASSIAVFDGSILATAAVSAPDVMVRSIGNALGGFDASAAAVSSARTVPSPAFGRLSSALMV